MNKIKVKVGTSGQDSEVLLVTPTGAFNIPASEIAIFLSHDKQTYATARLYVHEVNGEIMEKHFIYTIDKLRQSGLPVNMALNSASIFSKFLKWFLCIYQLITKVKVW